MFRAQSMYNQCFAIGTSPARDLNASYHAWGHSIAVDPWGNTLAQMDEKEGYQLLDIDLSKVESVRAQLPLINHRRTDLYELKLKNDEV